MLFVFVRVNCLVLLCETVIKLSWYHETSVLESSNPHNLAMLIGFEGSGVKKGTEFASGNLILT
jgi:hypothetical protein